MTVGGLLRQGAVTEIVGPLCSGRTSLLVACLGEVGRAGGAAALIDADDAFDPASAARAGVDLDRVLWVRCGGRRDAALRAADLLVRCPGFALVALDVGESPARARPSPSRPAAVGSRGPAPASCRRAWLASRRA